MRKVTQTVCRAFLQGRKARMGNTSTDGQRLYLHGNLIAERIAGERDAIRITDAGWQSTTTKERLNGLLRLAGAPVGIFQKDFAWFTHHAGQGATSPWLGEYRFAVRI